MRFSALRIIHKIRIKTDGERSNFRRENVHENIQVVLRHSKEEIEFLDFKTIFKDNKKKPDLYEKKSDAKV